MGSVWVIVVAAGGGRRFGGPKQFETLGDRRVVDWSIGAARQVADGIVLVVPPDRLPTRRRPAGEGDAGPVAGADARRDAGHEGTGYGGVDAVVAGASSRSGSVRAGLAAVPADADVILVHDGARPLAGRALFAAVVAAVAEGADAVVPAVAVTDTLRRRSGGTVARDDLLAVQTPQGFRAAALRHAHAGEPDATDDVSLVEAAGGKVVVVDGSPANLKVTHPIDLVVAEALLPDAGAGT